MKNIQTPAKLHLSALINSIKQGRYVIPDFQRKFEWEPSDVKDLITSILQDYYIGTLLLWKASRKNQESLGCENIETLEANGTSGSVDSIVLDGQQRLTAMHYAFVAPKALFPRYVWRYLWFIDLTKVLAVVAGEDNQILEDAVVQEFKNVENGERLKNDVGFQVKNKLFPCYLFEGGEMYFEWLMEYGRVWGEDEKSKIKNFFNELLNEFYVSYIELDSDMDIARVCDIFTRLNSKGVKLTVFDLLNAMMRPQGIKLKEMYDEIESTFRFTCNGNVKIFILQVISMLKQDYCSPKYLAYIVPGAVKKEKDQFGTLQEMTLIEDTQSFMQLWNISVGLIHQSLAYLQNPHIFGVTSEYFLPYTNIIPVLAVLLNEKSNNQNNAAHIDEKIKKWYWATVLTQNYSSSVNSKMTKDIQDMRKWFKDDNAIPHVVLESQQEIESIDLNREGPSSSIYKAIINLLFTQEAKDWITYQHMSLAEGNELNDHHIVPRSWGERQALRQIDINTILNRTLLYDNTNKYVIKDTLPKEYLKEMFKKAGNNETVYTALESHMISRNAVEILLREEFSKKDYEEFLKEREHTIMGKIRNIIGVQAKTTGMIAPENEFSNIVLIKNAIKSCEGNFIWVDKYISIKALEILHEAILDIPSGTIKSVKLLMAQEKVTEQLRDRFKHLRNELNALGICSELRVIVAGNIKNSIHDRWIMGDSVVYNIPSADVVARGQYSEIKKTIERPPVNEWWEQSLDIIDDWNKVAEFLKQN